MFPFTAVFSFVACVQHGNRFLFGDYALLFVAKVRFHHRSSSMTACTSSRSACCFAQVDPQHETEVSLMVSRDNTTHLSFNVRTPSFVMHAGSGSLPTLMYSLVFRRCRRPCCRCSSASTATPSSTPPRALCSCTSTTRFALFSVPQRPLLTLCSAVFAALQRGRVRRSRLRFGLVRPHLHLDGTMPCHAAHPRAAF